MVLEIVLLAGLFVLLAGILLAFGLGSPRQPRPRQRTWFLTGAALMLALAVVMLVLVGVG